ncbi:type II secretion system protein GspM [Thermochromatium tepidum]|jgi:General secretion pathway protein M.|uniref:General secretion pathway protein GspM n=1 Tax=Thermochromatium tepidum ATCC 43061 TaxID=316276 RepID=A0A6I6EAR8_THETI|nr:type II secretion system protein GspM [Thermochromatium tepidum]QGU32019.1 general secretion pathway protein GspM [Thermochromatium tepidum ATCC 43061]
MTLKPATDRPLCLGLVSAVVLAPILLVAAIAVFWIDRISELDDTIASHRDQLRRYQRLVGSLPALQVELEQARANDTFDAFYFKAPTQALAGAQIQTQIQEIVNAAAGRLISTQILPPEGQETPPRIRVRTQIQGSTETLMEMLYRFEQARPFLFVERLSVRSSARPTEPAGPGMAQRRLAADQGGELTVRLDIYGFVLGGAH